MKHQSYKYYGRDQDNRSLYIEITQRGVFITWPDQCGNEYLPRSWFFQVQYDWYSITEVNYCCKDSWLGKKIIFRAKIDSEYSQPAGSHLDIQLKVKNLETAIHVKEVMDTFITKSKKEHAERIRIEKEKKEKENGLRNQQIARAIELERSLIKKYKSGDFSEVTPFQFESIIKELFSSMGYSVKHVGGTGDQGIDLLCTDMSNHKVIIIQCKRYKREIGAAFVREFYGALVHSHADKGIIITTSHFTKDARQWVIGKPIDLIGKYRLRELMMKYYKTAICEDK